jgi:glutathione S-transferase
MTAQLTLVSHVLCPYVQRAVIVLSEKAVPFQRQYVDLANKPEWFLAVSPLGKTPVLLVNGTPLFESAVICEFLEETQTPRLHPQESLARARHRAWIEFSSAVLSSIAAFYTARDEAALSEKTRELRTRFEQLEAALEPGPYFAGSAFSLVDAAFGPVFRYFDVFEQIRDFGFFDGLSRVRAWRSELAARPSVRNAVRPDYPVLLMEFLRKRRSALAQRIAAHRMAAATA